MKKSLGLGILLAMTAPLWGQLFRGPGPNTSEQTLRVGELTRSYNLHVPPKLAKDKPVPLVLVFHGGGGTPAFSERESKFSELADREGFLVAYPEGVSKGWNDGRGDKTITAHRDGIDDLAFISALLDDVAKKHALDPKRVYATGISNGAIFSHYLAANLSSRIAAIAPVAGGLAEPFRAQFKPTEPISVLILQGTADPLVPYAGGGISIPGGKQRVGIVSTDDAVKRWTEVNGCKPQPTKEDVPDTDPQDGCRATKYTYAGGKRGSEVVLYRIEGGGHTWPGGIQYLGQRLIGKLCRDFDATPVMWEFFKAHPKP